MESSTHISVCLTRSKKLRATIVDPSKGRFKTEVTVDGNKWKTDKSILTYKEDIIKECYNLLDTIETERLYVQIFTFLNKLSTRRISLGG